MCFSATASFTLSAGLLGAGVLTLRNRVEAEDIPLYSFPLLFAAQQFIEGLLWLELDAGREGLWATVLTFGFLVFAEVLWPLLVPIAVYLIERDPFRKRVLKYLIPYGAAIAAFLAIKMGFTPYRAHVVGHSIQYSSSFDLSVWATTAYAFAVVFPLIICSRNLIVLFGGLVVLSLVITTEVYTHALFSVWCFFAAALSVIIYIFSLQEKRLFHAREQETAG